jgi:hypothetical protein
MNPITRAKEGANGGKSGESVGFARFLARCESWFNDVASPAAVAAAVPVASRSGEGQAVDGPWRWG